MYVLLMITHLFLIDAFRLSIKLWSIFCYNLQEDQTPNPGIVTNKVCYYNGSSECVFSMLNQT